MVYFDDARHLVADSKTELLDFMKKAGIKKCWLHHWVGERPHCDLPKQVAKMWNANWPAYTGTRPKAVVPPFWFVDRFTFAKRVSEREILKLSKAMAHTDAHAQ